MIMLLGITAVLNWLFGGMLLLYPEKFYALTGIAMTPMVATLAQAHGATLLGLGVMNWLIRFSDKRGLLAALIGNFVIQGLSLCVVIRMMQIGAGMAVAPGVVIHIVLASLFAVFFIRACRL